MRLNPLVRGLTALLLIAVPATLVGCGDASLTASTHKIGEGLTQGHYSARPPKHTNGSNLASATITDTGFTYSGTWQTVANPSEHWTGASGATATVQFNAASGGSTFALKAHRDTSNGMISVAIDGGTPVNVNENGASSFGYTVYTSGVLAAGNHTVVLRRVSGEVSVMGATISNGTFGASNPSPTVTASATAGDGQATLSWTVNNGPITGLTGWRVDRDGSDTNGTGAWGTNLAASATSQTFLSLINGQAYNLKVAPIVNGTVGTAVTKQVTPTGTTPPANPTLNASATVSNRNDSQYATLTWTVDNGPYTGLTGWRVSRVGVDAAGNSFTAVDITNTNITNYLFDLLAGATTYHLSVAPIINGVAGSATTVTITTPDLYKSVADDGFTYNGAWNTAAGEHWTADHTATASVQFTIANPGGQFFFYGKRDVSNATVRLRIDGNVTTNYNYVVNEADTAQVTPELIRIDNLGAGSHTIVVSYVDGGDISITGAKVFNGTFTPPTTPPAQPTVNATATSGDGQATLSWTVSNGPITGLTGWRVARDGNDTGGAGPWTTDLGASSTSQTFLSLINGNTYNLTVAPIVNGTAGTASSAQAKPVAAGGGTTPPSGGGGTGNSGTNTTGGSGGIIGGPASSSNPSGYAPPTADAFGSGYTQTISQDFGTAASEGQFGSKYPGWNGYDGVPDGNVSGLTWESAQISAANSVLTLRNSGGKAHCQAITPIIPGTGSWNTQAQKYGKYVLRFKSRGQTGYKIAFLLWPTDNNWNSGEIDFPEGNLVGDNTGMTGNSHNVTGNPVDGIYKASGVRVDDGNWHTATIEWEPNSVKFAMDGTVFSTVTNPSYIPSVNMRWDLQVETSPDQATGGTVYVDIDWMVQYKKN